MICHTPFMKKTLAVLAASLLAPLAHADEWHVLGSRAMGMGGAGVASTVGPLASYWNPAALGRATSNSYGVQVPVGVHYGLTGSVVEGANDLNNLQDTCGAACTPADITAALDKLDQPGNGLRVNADAGLNAKFGRLGLFVNGFADIGAVPRADRVNTSAAQIAAGTNESRLIFKGASFGEFGAGYGRELGFAPGLFVGGNLKLINAQVGHTEYFILRQSNDEFDFMDNFKANAVRSTGFGADAGVLWDVARSIDGVPLRPRFGLVGRNVNNPKFKQPASAGSGKYALNPQLRAGASLQPFNWWTLAADLDISKNRTTIDNVASRQFGAGTEINVFNRSWFNIPLRAGLSRNLAEKSAGTMLTGGVGLNFLHFMADLSVAASPKNVQTQSRGENKKLPRELMAGLQLSFLIGGSDEEKDSLGRTMRDEPRPAPKAQDDQPVSSQKVREAAEKAHQDLKKEEQQTP